MSTGQAPSEPLISALLEFLAQKGWTEDGGDFFRALVEHIGRMTGVDYVIVDRMTADPQVAETVALYARGSIVPNLQYHLKGTPCENVVAGQLCCYAEGIQRLFPNDTLLVEMQAESYIGIPLWDSDGRTLGLIALIDSKPMPAPEPYAALIRLAATRAAAELDRGRTMAELARKNRALRMLSSSNRALSRIADEDALLQEICGIAVDEGGHRMAWVSFAEQDEAKTWRHAARAGAGPLVVGAPTNTWSEDSPTGRGPGGIAVRTGQPKVVRDILNDPAAALWREQAKRCGYRSVVALPLRSGDLTYAVLVICSIEADVFDAEEVEILNELASNLGVGIMALRERKRVDAERHARQAAEIANQAKSAFLAQMSHELRTPLNAIVGFTQILQRDNTLTEKHTRALKIIRESGQHLLTLINDILDLARIEAAKFELFPHDFDMRVMLQLVGDIVRVKADDKDVRFAYHGDSDLPRTVRADEKRLRQVLLNLLSNAVKFTDAGQVTLRAMRLPMAGSAGAAARLRFEIEDQGIGMSETQVVRLFQPFEQMGEAKRREGGTGLGLAISRQLVRLMGGDIEVRSRPGEGSLFAFEIELPVSEAPARDLPVESTPLGYLGERRKILVVGEVLQNRTLLVEELEALGFEVANATNGREALEVVARFHPHLLVVDLTTPVEHGIEAMLRLRQMPEYADLPIIAASASATADAEERSRAAGANVFVGKPIQEGMLLNDIAALLHLEWIREPAPAASGESTNDDGPVVAPPAEEMSVLRGLAREGDMRSILGRADYVRTLDPRYAAFAARLRALAERHEASAIARMIERYSNLPAEPTRT